MPLFTLAVKTTLSVSTNYNQSFASIVKKNNIYGVQFHPEKSLKNGLKILDNFLKLNE